MESSDNPLPSCETQEKSVLNERLPRTKRELDEAVANLETTVTTLESEIFLLQTELAEMRVELGQDVRTPDAVDVSS
jgi:chaperonin cofactor prefoldin